ncbi:MAG: TorF family putative porin [Candidatus Protistobacter heckmanni]|nr:TorF family putative porin [Candidatus Protistobacter heckmanni]
MKKAILVSAVATMMAAPAFVLAKTAPAAPEEPAPAASPFTGNMTIASEYRYRGIAQTNLKPAIQGGFDYAFRNGFYIGNWNSNISWLSDGYTDTTPSPSRPIEMDFYGGYKGDLSGLGYDVGLLQYYYPGTSLPTTNACSASRQACGTSPNTLEGYLSLSYAFATLKYSYAFTNLFGIDNSKCRGYLDLSLNYDTGMYGLTLNGHVGRQTVSHTTSVGSYSYTDWKLGVTKDLGNGFSGSLAYIGSNAKIAVYGTPDGNNAGRGTALLSVTKTF